MEPLTAILLIGIMTVATVKTAGTAVNDGIASARGHTPPTQERWRANEEKRRERGEKPRKDPGGIRRIWQNQMEYAGEKSAKKHQGRMEYLADHGDEIAAGKRGRMERADRHRQAVGGVLARAGGSSWEAMKTAAQKAADARRNHAEGKTEQAAWRENERRDADTAGWVDDDGRGHPRRFSSESRSGWALPVVYGEDGNPYCVHTDGSWSPYESVPIEAEDAVADDTVVPFIDRNEIAARWSAAIAHGEDTADVLTVAEWNALPLSTRAQMIREARYARVYAVVITPGGVDHALGPNQLSASGGGPGIRRDAPGSEGVVRGGPSSPATGSQSGPPYKQFPWHRDLDWHRQHYQHQMQQGHEREDEFPPTDTHPDETDPTSTEGTDAMSSHSGEITDLTSALQYVTSASEYCEQLHGKLENPLSQANTAADEIGDEAGGLETAISALNGFDLTNEAARLSSVQEHYNAVVEAMQDVETAVTTAREAIASAQSELDDSAAEFESQTGISEQVSSHDEVASDMDFYVNA